MRRYVKHVLFSLIATLIVLCKVTSCAEATWLDLPETYIIAADEDDDDDDDPILNWT